MGISERKERQKTELRGLILAECISENRIHFTNPDLASITVWSHLHGLIALSVRGRMIMISEEIIPSLIHQSVDSMLEFIFKKH